MSPEPRGDNIVERHYPLIVTIALGASLLLHGVAYATLPLVPAASRTDLVSEVTFEVPPAPAPTPEVPVAPPPKPEPEQPVAQRPRPAPQPPAPPPESVPEAPPPAAESAGVTLTDDTGAGEWSSATGNGQPMVKPQRTVALRRAVTTVASSTPRPKPATNRLVPPGDLSERPRPPALDGVLRRHYPEDARRRGISGTASVRAEVGADGRVRQPRVLSESFPGFGEACRRTLAGSRWSPPKDRQGNAVPTEIGYKCRFVVDR